jgi:hypothetical protein
MSRDSLQRLLGKAEIDPSIYDEVFNADIEPKNLEAVSQRCGVRPHFLRKRTANRVPL